MIIEDQTNFYYHYDKASGECVVTLLPSESKYRTPKLMCQVPTRSKIMPGAMVMMGKCDSVIIYDDLIIIV